MRNAGTRAAILVAALLAPAVLRGSDTAVALTVSAGCTQLEWSGDGASAYWIQRSGCLAVWNELPAPLLGDGSLLHYQEPAPTGSRAFFRLRIEPVLARQPGSADPRDDGWLRTNFFRFVSETGGVATDGTLQPQWGMWRSPPFAQPPFDYVRIDFSIRRGGTPPDEIWVSGLGYHDGTDWGRFYPNGAPFNDADPTLHDDDWSVFPSTDDWTRHTCYTRVRPNASATSVLFWGYGGGDTRVDDIVVTPAGDDQVADWADAVYAERPPLAYAPPAGRHTEIAATMARIASGGTLRIVMVGDSLMQDLTHSAVDALLERAHPGLEVDLSAAVGSSTGLDKWNNPYKTPPDPADPLEPPDWPNEADTNLTGAVIDQQPDLVLLGGISNSNPDGNWNTHFPGAITKVRDECQRRFGYQPDFLLVVGPYFFVGEPGNTASYRADLQAIAATHGTGYLDMAAAVEDYFDALPGSGFTVADFQRDDVHAEQHGKQIFGRILLRWLEPE